MEDYTYHLGDPVPEVLGAHMLEVCPSLAGPDGRISGEIHPLAIGGKPDPVRLVFNAATGPAVILGMADLGDRFRLIASEVDLVEPDAPLPKLPVARAVWRPRPDLPTAAEAWLTAGGPHHTALTTALPIEPLRDFADIADVELAAIGADTTTVGFAQELRWNAAYHYLARRP
jgi:L-arabinose isomerase